jgi:hypothetical protein
MVFTLPHLTILSNPHELELKILGNSVKKEEFYNDSGDSDNLDQESGGLGNHAAEFEIIEVVTINVTHLKSLESKTPSKEDRMEPFVLFGVILPSTFRRDNLTL